METNSSFLKLPVEIHHKIAEFYIEGLNNKPFKPLITNLSSLALEAPALANNFMYGIYFEDYIQHNLPPIKHLFSDNNIKENLSKAPLTRQKIINAYKEKLKDFSHKDISNQAVKNILDCLHTPINKQIKNLQAVEINSDVDKNIAFIKFCGTEYAHLIPIPLLKIINDLDLNRICNLSWFGETSQGAKFLNKNFNEIIGLVDWKVSEIGRFSKQSYAYDFLQQNFDRIKSFEFQFGTLEALYGFCDTKTGSELLNAKMEEIKILPLMIIRTLENICSIETGGEFLMKNFDVMKAFDINILDYIYNYYKTPQGKIALNEGKIYNCYKNNEGEMQIEFQ